MELNYILHTSTPSILKNSKNSKSEEFFVLLLEADFAIEFARWFHPFRLVRYRFEKRNIESMPGLIGNFDFIALKSLLRPRSRQENARMLIAKADPFST